MTGIRYGLQVYKDAQADIKMLLESDPKSGGKIVTFLQELGGDQPLLDSLNIEDYEDDKITVRALARLQEQRWNGWRLTIRDINPPEDKLPYRILYTFDGKARVYHVLAVRHRSVVYDDATIDRACNACRSLGLDPLPRR
jgi:hypothetical protein